MEPDPDDSPGQSPEGLGSKWPGWVVSGVVFLALGACVGVLSVLTVEHFASQVRFFSWMAILAAMAAGLLLLASILAIIRWAWRHRGESYLIQVRDAVAGLFTKPAAHSWSDHLAEVWNKKGRLLWNALIVMLAVWVGIALLSPLVGGLFSFAGYLSGQAQVQMTDTQNRIVAIEQEFQQANSYAEQRFQQISKVLLNVDASPGEYVFALREVPDAMRMTVPRAVVDETASGGVRIVYALPNLNRLRDVVRQFISMDRVTATLRKADIPHNQGEPLSVEGMKALEPLTPVSTELLHLLHRLGPAEENDAERHLWSWTGEAMPNAVSVIPQVVDLGSIPAPRAVLDDRGEAALDLTHLRERDLERLVAPCLFVSVPWWNVTTRDGSSLIGAQLQGADLGESQLSRADFSEACLQGANLHKVQLQETDFLMAQMEGINLMEANLQAAYLNEARLQGALLVRAQLQGADFGKAHLLGANLSEVALHGAIFDETLFLGTNLNGAQMQGTILSHAQFYAARPAGDFGGRKIWLPRTPSIEDRELWRESRFTQDPEHPVCLIVPGAVIESTDGLLPSESIFLEIEDKPAFVRALRSAKHEFSNGPPIHEMLTMPSAELDSLPWPASQEYFLSKLPGVKGVRKQWRGILVMNGEFRSRARFANNAEAAWLSSEVREAILKSFDGEPYVSLAQASPDAAKQIEELREELTSGVNHPGTFPSEQSWIESLEERKKWRIATAYRNALQALNRTSPRLE